MDMYPRFTQLETRHRETVARERLRAARASVRRRTGFVRRLRNALSGRA
jgi:hypothetical protein